MWEVLGRWIYSFNAPLDSISETDETIVTGRTTTSHGSISNCNRSSIGMLALVQDIYDIDMFNPENLVTSTVCLCWPPT